MNAVILTLFLGFFAVTASVILVLTGYMDEAVAFFKVHGQTILIVLQVIGLFWAGMMGKFKLGAILVCSILATIFWGW
ncbi:hypothetical protein TALC_00376 [Thermoplasmatales archaeon BRNA1]|nr:hypothetical protein TALC_00376 [Thermoplasmatales archaeon BRNA1]